MNVDSLMRAVGVRRWHTEPQLGEETDGHHCAVVALLADYLGSNEELGAEERYLLLRESLRHDLGEYWAGDMPAPVKKLLPPELLAALDAAEAQFKLVMLRFGPCTLLGQQSQLLALADSLAAAVHCARQAWLGSKEGTRILRILTDYVQAHLTTCTLKASTQLQAIQLLRECAMMADSDLLLVKINAMEESIHAGRA